MASFTAIRFSFALETVTAVNVLLWQDMHPDFCAKVTSVRCKGGMLLSIASRTDPAGLKFSCVSVDVRESFAPAEINKSTTAVLPRAFAKSRAVWPWGFFAFTSAH